MNNLTFGDEGMGYYETIAGGAGAGPHWHGRSGVHTHMTNTCVLSACHNHATQNHWVLRQAGQWQACLHMLSPQVQKRFHNILLHAWVANQTKSYILLKGARPNQA